MKAADLSDHERQARLLDLCRKVVGLAIHCLCQRVDTYLEAVPLHPAQLVQEVKYLQTIGWRRAAVRKADRAEHASHLLQQAAAPKQWAVRGGGSVSVITQSVAR